MKAFIDVPVAGKRHHQVDDAGIELLVKRRVFRNQFPESGVAAHLKAHVPGNDRTRLADVGLQSPAQATCGVGIVAVQVFDVSKLGTADFDALSWPLPFNTFDATVPALLDVFSSLAIRFIHIN